MEPVGYTFESDADGFSSPGADGSDYAVDDSFSSPNTGGVSDVTSGDLNGDGQIDTYALDGNQDGYTDTYRTDANADGYFESVAYDQNQDGTVEAVVMDSDGNGTLESASFDSDQNGVFERVDMDIDGDGTHESTLFDDNQDSVLDHAVLGVRVPETSTPVSFGGNEVFVNGPDAAKNLSDIQDGMNRPTLDILYGDMDHDGVMDPWDSAPNSADGDHNGINDAIQRPDLNHNGFEDEYDGS